MKKIINKIDKRKIVLFGGSFDPVHIGHLAAAKLAMYELEADTVFLIPAGSPPHKSHELTEAVHRLEMLKLAVKSLDYFEVLDIEINRQGKSYTIDTIREIKALYPEAKLYFAVGSDMLEGMSKWKDIALLFSLCSFAVIKRPGNYDDANKIAHKLKEEYNADIRLLGSSNISVSSSKLRAELALERPQSFFLPDGVENYIIKEMLYSSFSEIRRLCIKKCRKVYEKVEATLSAKRFAHTLGTADVAVRLAEGCGHDSDKALLAALLHDYAKNMTYSELFEYCGTKDIVISSYEKDNPELLHAIVGADMAEKEFLATDTDVLNAIKYHTTGRPDMSILERIIFVADCVEQTRVFIPDREKLLETAFADLDKAFDSCLMMKIKYTKTKEYKTIYEGRTSI